MAAPPPSNPPPLHPVAMPVMPSVIPFKSTPKTPAMPPVSMPSLPPVSMPSLPPVSMPSLPSVSMPPVSMPTISMPPVSMPPVSMPHVVTIPKPTHPIKPVKPVLPEPQHIGASTLAPSSKSSIYIARSSDNRLPLFMSPQCPAGFSVQNQNSFLPESHNPTTREISITVPTNISQKESSFTTSYGSFWIKFENWFGNSTNSTSIFQKPRKSVSTDHLISIQLIYRPSRTSGCIVNLKNSKQESLAKFANYGNSNDNVKMGPFAVPRSRLNISHFSFQINMSLQEIAV